MGVFYVLVLFVAKEEASSKPRSIAFMVKRQVTDKGVIVKNPLKNLLLNEFQRLSGKCLFEKGRGSIPTITKKDNTSIQSFH